jgi:uncharacterized C2H2 Zn-finger protein
MSAIDRLEVMRKNVFEVLIRSTLMPFRWLKSSYRCFFCYDLFEEPKDLKAHQVVHRTDAEKRKAMSNYWEPTVYVDISDLSCKLCTFSISDIYKFVDHLIAIHKMPFNKSVDIFMSPFKLNQISVQCIQCDQECRTFGHLLQHTNREHKGVSQVLCDICGRHFKNTTHLKEHISREHTNKAVKCQVCGEEVPSSTRMRTHMQRAHNKTYKCFVCTDVFETHYRRSHHMMTVHKHRDEVKCQHCPRIFVFRSTMMRHLRETHLQERNAVCAICGWRAFGTHRLQRHMMKHSNDRNFKCPSCDKAFKTKKTMKQHYINIHEKMGVQGVPGVYDATHADRDLYQ